MPIIRQTPTTRISQEEFSSLAFEVMSHVHDIHNEFGRFFDERVYKRELADRMTGLELELPVTVTHKTFSKTYQLDVLARRRGIFEFKAAESIVSQHRSQAFNYLLLFDLPHGKIINVRPELVRSEFVNYHQRLEDLRDPLIAPDVAFRLTAFTERLDAFETHARRLLQHTTLKAIQWVNITTHEVTFTTLR